MHIRFNRALRGDYGRVRPGDVKLVSKDVARSLISRGLAVETVAPEDDDAALDAKLAALSGKSPDQVKEAHSGPELRKLLARACAEAPALNASKATMATALVDALAARDATNSA